MILRNVWPVRGQQVIWTGLTGEIDNCECLKVIHQERCNDDPTAEHGQSLLQKRCVLLLFFVRGKTDLNDTGCDFHSSLCDEPDTQPATQTPTDLRIIHTTCITRRYVLDDSSKMVHVESALLRKWRSQYGNMIVVPSPHPRTKAKSIHLPFDMTIIL